jgi:uncharacterized membrane protein
MAFWKKHPNKFFSPEEQARILEEIRRAEKRSSGEIRVHLDRYSEGDVLEKAEKIFGQLGMKHTRERNGVLVYLATDHRKFAILGDKGIQQIVSGTYWEDVKEGMQEYFRQGKFCEGLCWGIRRIGETLEAFFPPLKKDVNELPNEISERA